MEVAVIGATAKLRPEGIVIHPLDDGPLVGACRRGHLADVAEMVAVVVIEGDFVPVGVVGVLFRLAVALLELQLVDAPVGFHPTIFRHGKARTSSTLLIWLNQMVPQCEAAPEEVVRGVRTQYLRGGELPGAADGNSDVRDRRLVDDAQLLARRAVDVPGHAAVFFHR